MQALMGHGIFGRKKEGPICCIAIKKFPRNTLCLIAKEIREETLNRCKHLNKENMFKRLLKSEEHWKKITDRMRAIMRKKQSDKADRKLSSAPRPS